MRVRRVSAERNAERMLTGILIGLDKLIKMCYRRKEKEELPLQVRTLVAFRDGKGKKCREGEIIMVTPGGPRGQGIVYPMYYTGTRLLPSEYEPVIPDTVFDKLLEGNDGTRPHT